jgi:hypothetical protein
MSMLRGSIQALEVQRGTIATLKSIGASLAAAITQPGASDKSVFESVPYASAFFQQPAAPAPEAKPAPAPAPAPAPEPAAAAPNDAAMRQPSWPIQRLVEFVTRSVQAGRVDGDVARCGGGQLRRRQPGQASGRQSAKPAEATAAKAKAPLRKAPAKRAAPKARRQARPALPVNDMIRRYDECGSPRSGCRPVAARHRS